MKKREEIEEKYKWDLTEYFDNLDSWEKTFEFVKENYKQICEYENKLNRILDFEITRINENFKIDAVLLKGSNITDNLVNKIEETLTS